MSNSSFIVFYASENAIEAEKIDAAFNMKSTACYTTESNPIKFKKFSKDPSSKAILLLSDNFLKDIALGRILEFLLEEHYERRILPVITPSRRASDGKILEYSTQISTLNDVMKYRDYWYDQWIQLRKSIKSQEGSALLEMEKDLEVAKSLSVGAITKYIRKINALSPVEWDTFVEDQFDDQTGTLKSNESDKKENSQSEAKQQQSIKSSEAKPVPIVPMKRKTKKEETSNETPAIKKVQTSKKKEKIIQKSTSNASNKRSNDKLKNMNKVPRASKVKSPNTLRKEYKSVLRDDPFNVEAWTELAILLSINFTDNKKLVKETFRKAITLNEEEARLHFHFGVFLSEFEQDHQKAQNALYRVLELNSDHKEAYFALAKCQLKMGFDLQAKANYLQACILDASTYQHATNDELFSVVRKSEPKPSKQEDESSDRIAMITGASSGIGQSIAKKMVAEGYKVILTARRTEKLNALKSEMEAAHEGAQIYCLTFDVTDLKATERAIKKLPESWSEVDILINNAGLAKGLAPVQEGEISHWEAMIDTNIKGLLYMTRLLTPGMVKRKKGHVVNISSVAATQVYTGGGAYCATKAAVDSLTKSMRLDLYQHNIKVSSVSPGHVDATEFAAVRYDDSSMNSIYADFKPLCADDIADTVFFILSRPDHVNIQDILLFGKQQASVRDIDRSGRNDQ